ncbi:PREDICTED: homeobox-leucine zipper protein HDG11-like [Camelina sativa]|uniref:Homeobox-leucine zipper protein HDG11-like n=1 Tax=Camelina sativa TaxID=90675 RepID=A0ABM0U027_CAMSA|nr:PREDICTED: homeobox-leucine zipper protein HDG11-like [Camelina sativa]
MTYMFKYDNVHGQWKHNELKIKSQSLFSASGTVRVSHGQIIAIREALKPVICPNCGGPPVSEDPYFDEQSFGLKMHILEKRLGCTISFSECGGIEIEENCDKVIDFWL